jgi:hypothetical protein
MQQSALDFITHARGKGMDHATIRVLLLSAGWKEKDVAHALAAEGLDVAVPEPPGGGGAREAFHYLLLFTALYTMAVSLIVLFFQYLDILFPDPAWQRWEYAAEFSRSTIRWSLSALIVSSPLFYWLTFVTTREVRANPDRARSAIRRWLTYLTLFVAAVTAMFDLITLLYYFLQGELTTRIALKVLVLLVIVGIAFVYYLLSLRGTPEEQP